MLEDKISPKICLILPYFGELPKYWSGFIESCAENSDIDFLIISDCQIINPPNNVRVIKMVWSEFKTFVAQKFRELGYERVCLTHPYKLCDYKPCFGYIFQNYINNYDYWGYVDCDLVFGNLMKFIQLCEISKYHRIYRYGHLSICRNSPEVNLLFSEKLSGCIDFKQVANTTFSCNFDECGFNLFFEKKGLKFYDVAQEADFGEYDYAFRSYNIGHVELGELFVKDADGSTKVYIQLDTGDVKCVEVNYIHFLSKKNITIPAKMPKPYCITHKGVFDISNMSIQEALDKYTLCSQEEQQTFLRNKLFAMRKASVKKILRELKYNHIYSLWNIINRIPGWICSLRYIHKSE